MEEVLNEPYFPLLKFEFRKYEDIVQLPMETVIGTIIMSQWYINIFTLNNIFAHLDVIGLFKEEVSRNGVEYVEMIDTENRKVHHIFTLSLILFEHTK